MAGTSDRIETVYLLDEDGGPVKMRATEMIAEIQRLVDAAPEHLKLRVYVRIGSQGGGALLTLMDDGEHRF
jgi:hypothetical protein